MLYALSYSINLWPTKYLAFGFIAIRITQYAVLNTHYSIRCTRYAILNTHYVILN